MPEFRFQIRALYQILLNWSIMVSVGKTFQIIL